ncbi:magnesium-translocating P-type ATPase [Meiothermus sp.]|jgi:Mg2+-importing ATPase|uniref:magnesium-translocating P-type ATPase n=1 Tax=Meiothermus sp. TaxID=1955249 RepID=UPI0021DE5B4F|nr:magnesium-translocating P-type ATPase [Meiothermus sp.]GIW25706.1 MAG: magnesium-translocating P-type ATPase [Meiothermus sp.]
MDPHVRLPSASVPYWAEEIRTLWIRLDSQPAGLDPTEARRRLQQGGPNTLQTRRRTTALAVLLAQFKSPLVLMLVFAASVSALVQEWVDAFIVLLIVLGSALLSFVQEYSASRAVEKLLARVQVRVSVLRGGQTQQIPAEEVVPGDVVLLSAGNLIPADGRVLEAKDFFVSQAALTGETFPVEKRPGVVPPQASLSERTNCVFMGTSVRSGTASVLVVETGVNTAFGQVADRLALRPPETDFERGIRQFGFLLTQVMLLMVLLVFTVNVFGEKPPVDSLLFAIALAVGLTPELLPAIVGVNLAKGAQRMAHHGVIVRRLSAIENLGSMDVLCTDKTGTLTEGVVQLDGALDARGQPSPQALRHAFWNAYFQTGLANPLDQAIVEAASQAGLDASDVQKVDEIPYDFSRKRLSVVVEQAGARLLVTKGALEPLLEVCTDLQDEGPARPLDDADLERLEALYSHYSEQGYRVLGLAYKPVSTQQAVFTRDDEQGLTFLGFLLFFDPPKAGVQDTLAHLARLGVDLKIITGDNRKVAAHLAVQVGMEVRGLLTGRELATLPDEALWHQAERCNLFVEVDPSQKERLILALQKTGHVVGYMGDGINDAPALHTADVGISVDQAVDVAKEAADLVLLESDLDVLREGIEEGRRTFANTLKYIFTTTSANFGNMFSMAGASAFLPFLPLLAKQILLNNFLSDLPAVGLATDNVDREWLEKPHRLEMRFIRNFMVVFGLISSVFDYLTFGLLLWVFRASPEQFRTGWFMESLLTELLVALVVRTRRPFFQSRPGRLLLWSTLLLTVLAVLIPYLPFSDAFGFVPLPYPLLLGLLGLTLLYVLLVEWVKGVFYHGQKLAEIM